MLIRNPLGTGWSSESDNIKLTQGLDIVNGFHKAPEFSNNSRKGALLTWGEFVIVRLVVLVSS